MLKLEIYMREKLVSSHANDTMLGDVCLTDYFNSESNIFK